MKVYQVGGSVRDELLGLEPKDRDFVVVGSSVEEMLSLGFEQVGKDFPVFLHPQTKEEYALARREKKTGTGYHGFTTETKDVTLEEDLFRRDLTINAMAKDESGNLIDPYGGKKDLKSKVLRHVSVHFAEDPLRVLRCARFQARFPDFTVSEETKELMKKLVQTELSSLPVERFSREFEKAFTEKSPFLFLKVLSEVGLFKFYLPEFTFSPKLKVIDKPASGEARLLSAVLVQEKPYSVFKAFESKLGFRHAFLKKVLDLTMQLRKTPFTSEDVVTLMLKSKAHQQGAALKAARETLEVLGESTLLLEEVLKVSKLFQESDFSFVETLPPRERSAAVKDYLLKNYLFIAD